MTRIRYVLPIVVLAALVGPVSAATLTLTDTWQNLGTGPLILQTQGGDGLFEASAAAPTDNGVAIGKNQTPFAYPSTLAIWGKRRAQARNNAGANVNTTLVTTPMTLAGGSGGSGTAADQTGDNSSNAVAPSATNQHTLSFGYYYNTATAKWEQIRGSGGALNVIANHYILDASGVSNPVGPNNPVPIQGPITCSNCSTTTVNGATFDGTLGSSAAYPDGGWVPSAALALTPGKAYTRPMTPEGANYSTSVPSASALVAPLTFSSTAAQTFASLKTSPGNFYSLYVTNFSTVAGYAVIGQTTATTAPASGTAITKSVCVPLPASGSTGLYQLSIPDAIPTGMAIYVSTSCYTYTPSTITADFHVQYK